MAMLEGVTGLRRTIPHRGGTPPRLVKVADGQTTELSIVSPEFGPPNSADFPFVERIGELLGRDLLPRKGGRTKNKD